VTPIRLTATGHPAVTGRHDKTLELTAAGSITARATCILAVSAGPLPGELPLLRERVRLTLSAGGVSAAVEGEVNPGWHSTGSLIVRRSGQLDADTYLVNATAAAADLPTDLLAALRVPGAAVEVTAEEVGTPAPVVLVLTGGPATDEIARLAAQADLVVDLTGRGAPPPPVPLTAPRRHGVPTGAAARTTVVLTDDLAAALPLTTGNRVLLWPPDPGADLLLSAGRPPTPLLRAGTANRDLARLLAATPAPALVDLAGADPAQLAPDHTVLADAPELGWGVRAADGVRGGQVVLVPPATDRVGIDAAELAGLLRAAGRSGRDTATELTKRGVPRREAYRLAADSGRDAR
jgi:hypothetical protein